MASKKLDKLKTAGADMDKFFSGASESPTDSPKKTTKRNTKREPEEPSEKPQKAQKKVFSFRAKVDQVDSWRVWADAKGMKVDELGEKALIEYIKRHALTEDQQTIYNLKMDQKGRS